MAMLKNHLEIYECEIVFIIWSVIGVEPLYYGIRLACALAANEHVEWPSALHTMKKY